MPIMAFRDFYAISACYIANELFLRLSFHLSIYLKFLILESQLSRMIVDS